jgi:2-polyprenyl-3-methyl-5-hydroxy-6-metoxy-1,4-benzoquinol methylase
VRCPACGHLNGCSLHRHTAAAAAQHFVPRQRDSRRHADLVAHLRELWGRDFVEVHVCPSCTFGYAVPWVGGDARFYELAHAGDPHYPADRWEFGRTIRVLERPAFKRRLRVLEVGAGDGAFLDDLRRLGPHEMLAADYDAGAVRGLREKGYEAIVGSLADISTGSFDVVCLFQTLEHMADLDAVFENLHRLLAPDGSVFLSVPNGEATDFQEHVTGYWDMPPNHVGRWNPTALARASERHGFSAVAVETEPLRARQVAWQLAVYSVNGRSYTPGTLDNRINAIASRPARGLVKRVLAAARLPPLLAMRRRFRPLTCWAHLTPADPGRGLDVVK